MPYLTGFALPETVSQLQLPNNDTDAKLFLAFVSSKDPATNQAWCPDVRAAMPPIDAAFSGLNAPSLAVVEVGQKPEWKDPSNIYRTKWNITSIPSLVRYQRVNGEPVETGRLTEAEILNKEKLVGFIS